MTITNSLKGNFVFGALEFVEKEYIVNKTEYCEV